jgi:hypothetical protein
MTAAPLPLPLCLLLALAAGPAAAQADDKPSPAPRTLVTPVPVPLQRQALVQGGAMEGQLSFTDSVPAQVVKGAPYCADAVHETVQWLPDPQGAAGNRIVTRQSTRLCRDGEGRTRQEVDRGGRKRVYLHDPVAREDWMLDPERKTARRLPGLSLIGTAAMSGDAGWHLYAERMRDWAQDLAERTRSFTAGVLPPKAGHAAAPPALPARPAPPAPVVVTRAEGSGPGADIQVTPWPQGDAPAPATDLPAPPLPVQWQARLLAPRGTGSTQPLGSKEVEGVPAHGERTTWLIEAGRIGNERPIQITREVWTSPDLMVTVQSRDFDPRTGEASYRLTNLRRGEPDPALMRVPADFDKGSPAVPRSAAPPASAVPPNLQR